MAKNGKGSEPAAETLPPRIQIANQFIRDMSFENVAAQKQLGDVKPEISVQVNLDAHKRGDIQYEVILRLTVSAKDKEQTIFLLEIDYAGLFVIENVAEDQLHPILMIECPRLIFPFVRRIVRDVTADGGFPPLNVDNIDFMALYRQELARRSTEQEATPAS